MVQQTIIILERWQSGNASFLKNDDTVNYRAGVRSPPSPLKNKESAVMQNEISYRYTSRFLYFAYEAWFIIFENGLRIACYHGEIINHDSSRIKQQLRLWDITPYQIRTGGDIHIYEFEHNDIDIADELTKGLTKIL